MAELKQILATPIIYMLSLIISGFCVEEVVKFVEPPTLIQCQNCINNADDIEAKLRASLQNYLSTCQFFTPNKILALELNKKLETATNSCLEFQQKLCKSLSSKYLGTSYGSLSSSGAYLDFMQWYSYLINRLVIRPLQLFCVNESYEQSSPNLHLSDDAQQLLAQREIELYRQIKESIEKEWSSVESRKEAFEEIGAWDEIAEQHRSFTQSIHQLQTTFPTFREDTLSFIQYPYQGSLLSTPIRMIAFIEITTWYLDFLEQRILNDS